MVKKKTSFSNWCLCYSRVDSISGPLDSPGGPTGASRRLERLLWPSARERPGVKAGEDGRCCGCVWLCKHAKPPPQEGAIKTKRQASALVSIFRACSAVEREASQLVQRWLKGHSETKRRIWDRFERLCAGA